MEVNKMNEFTQEVTISKAIGGGYAIYADGQLAAVVERNADLVSHVAQLFQFSPLVKNVTSRAMGADETMVVLQALVKGVRSSDLGGSPITISMIKAIRSLTGCTLKQAKETFEQHELVQRGVMYD